MNRTLFITGSSGFIGKHLLRRLPLNQYEHIYCLSRNQTELTKEFSQREDFHFIQGNLLEPVTYESQLAAADTVIHLAAVTGKAKRQEYFDVNTDGTATLVEKCKTLGVKHFLHTSTIAVKYANVKYYHYAQSKQLAEEIVRNSGLEYAIIRPTIVLAKDASIWQSLLDMASKSLIMIPGSGLVKIQPIYVDDLIDCILYILSEQLFENKALDLGGPEVLTFESFLRQIHRGGSQKEPRVVHLPLGLMRGCLGFLEKCVGSGLPVTAGQLSAFGNDGLADDNGVTGHHREQMKGVEEIVRLLTHE
ncbi:MAG: NAD-dependent epimerase/dehydratase family protein [Sedimentisphaerales bacterium]|nr:NAD-dependent epimerase/dehydratase family protein [Sedimentisphaerales bacterium]